MARPLYATTLQTTDTTASSVLCGGGATFGTGAVALVTTAGKLASLNSTYVATITANTAGKILRSDGTNFINTTATYPDTATGTGTLLRADGTNWSATTATYPTTTTANQLLYSSATNVIGGLSTAASSVLATDASSVPSLTQTLPSAVQSNITRTGTLTAGATGAGFTVALSTSTITGTLPAAQFPALTGDLTTVAGALATTLATVNANVGSVGGSTAIPAITVNAKGLITAATTAAVIAPAGTLTGSTLASGVTASSLTSVGALTGGSTGAGFTVNFALATLSGILPAAYGGTNNAFFQVSGPASSVKTYTLPNSSTTLVTIADTGTVTNTMLAGSIAASKLVGTDIATVGTITAGTWNAGAVTSSGVLTVNGAGQSIFSASNGSGNNEILIRNTSNANNVAGGMRIGNDITQNLGLMFARSSTYVTTANYDIANGLDITAAGAGGFSLGTTAAQPLRIYTNGAEKVRIFSSGGVSIGNTTDPGNTNLSVTGTVNGLTLVSSFHSPGSTTPVLGTTCPAASGSVQWLSIGLGYIPVWT